MNAMQNTEQQIIRIIAQQAVLEPEDVKLDDSLADLGIDSMGLVETIFSIEETFDISVPFNANTPDDAGFDISSVKAIINAVNSLIKEQH